MAAAGRGSAPVKPFFGPLASRSFAPCCALCSITVPSQSAQTRTLTLDLEQRISGPWPRPTEDHCVGMRLSSQRRQESCGPSPLKLAIARALRSPRSTRITKSLNVSPGSSSLVRSLRNAIRRPSGDQIGRRSDSSCLVRRRGFVPSLRITQTSVLYGGSHGLSYAIRRPFGDQAGLWA